MQFLEYGGLPSSRPVVVPVCSFQRSFQCEASCSRPSVRHPVVVPVCGILQLSQCALSCSRPSKQYKAIVPVCSILQSSLCAVSSLQHPVCGILLSSQCAASCSHPSVRHSVVVPVWGICVVSLVRPPQCLISPGVSRSAIVPLARLFPPFFQTITQELRVRVHCACFRGLLFYILGRFTDN